MQPFLILEAWLRYNKIMAIPKPIFKPKYKICVSGAAETGHCAKDALEKAREIGREIVRHGGVLVTGATQGIPHWAAMGAKEEGGISIGLSPAASEAAHKKVYRLPTAYFDVIIYTGFQYSGRNLLLTRTADAVILLCGRMGTLNEFTIAFEEQKLIGVLKDTGGTADLIRDLVRQLHKESGKIVYDTNPRRLVKKIFQILQGTKVESMDKSFFSHAHE